MATQDKLESVSEVFKEELVHTKCATINTTPVGKSIATKYASKL